MATRQTKQLKTSKFMAWVLFTPPEEKTKVYILLTTLGSFLAGGVKFTPIPFFSDKHNIINQLFVKKCWAWTILLTVLLFSIRIANKRATMKRGYLAVLHLVYGTLFWYISTTLIDGLGDRVGICSNKTFLTKDACILESNTWKPMIDISGHAFMLTFCNLFLGHQLDTVDTLIHAEHTVPNYIERTIFFFIKGLVAMFEVMFCMTIMYWHSPAEKILGTLLGVLGYNIMAHRMSQYLPF